MCWLLAGDGGGDGKVIVCLTENSLMHENNQISLCPQHRAWPLIGGCLLSGCSLRCNFVIVDSLTDDSRLMQQRLTVKGQLGTRGSKSVNLNICSFQ